MLKSGRLIEKSIIEIKNGFEQIQKANIEDGGEDTEYCEGAVDVSETIRMHTEISEGDIMTGWEIIAGLPLEEQLVISIDGSGCIKDYIASTDSCDCDCAECFSERLNKLYRWNGESWEVVTSD